MVALHWYPDRSNNRCSTSTVPRSRLTASPDTNGRSLESDYRHSVLWQIATPVWNSNVCAANVSNDRGPDCKNFDEADESAPIPPST
jgi:hypothetical protein